MNRKETAKRIFSKGEKIGKEVEKSTMKGTDKQKALYTEIQKLKDAGKITEAEATKLNATVKEKGFVFLAPYAKREAKKVVVVEKK